MDSKEYRRTPKEELACNLCAGRHFATLAKRDRYFLPVRTVICKGCGLIFINPRMTEERYSSFYKSGEYRRLLRKFKGREVDLQESFNNARKLGNRLAELLQSYIKGGHVVEVGSSTGGILTGFTDKIRDIEVLGIEPSEDETIFARNKGIRTIQASLESMEESTLGADTIVSVRSLNHLLDPRRFFAWSNRVLNPRGHLIILVADFTKVCEKRGMLFPQIDHPYMFTAETLQCLVTSTGFEIPFCNTETIGSNSYILVVGKKHGESVGKKPITQNEQAQQIAVKLADYKPPGIFYQIKHYRKVIKKRLTGKLRQQKNLQY